jgi:hypothetical protein
VLHEPGCFNTGGWFSAITAEDLALVGVARVEHERCTLRDGAQRGSEVIHQAGVELDTEPDRVLAAGSLQPDDNLVGQAGLEGMTGAVVLGHETVMLAPIRHRDVAEERGAPRRLPPPRRRQMHS